MDLTHLRAYPKIGIITKPAHTQAIAWYPKLMGGIVGRRHLAKIFADRRQRASIINFDADLYTSTICALTHAKPIIDQHTILIFDEFIMNKNWEQDEYKALQEFCNTHNYKYEVVAISLFTKQVAVKIIEP